MEFKYELDDAGWACASLACDGQFVEMTVSYLHDSLGELASALAELMTGGRRAQVTFMDEPAEHDLVFERTHGDSVDVEVVWHADRIIFPTRTQSLLRCSVHLADLRDQVVAALRQIFNRYGMEGYKARWIEHEFPIAQLEELSVYAEVLHLQVRRSTTHCMRHG
jgi:hypothetical protein